MLGHGRPHRSAWHRFALGDWLIIVLLLTAAALVDQLIAPHTWVFDPSDPRLRFPLLNSTVPSWALSLLFVFPLSAFGVVLARRCGSERNAALVDFFRSVTALLLSFSCHFLVVVIAKKVTGRPRPNCLAYGEYNAATGQFQAPEHTVWDAFESFPSGHSSAAFNVLLYCSLYMVQRFKIAADPLNSGWKIVLSSLPTLVAFWVGITRIRDYWHNTEDVLGGAAVGSLFAALVFVVYAPRPPNGRKPGNPQTGGAEDGRASPTPTDSLLDGKSAA